MASLLSELINLGLSEKEAKVYLASLELGPSTVAQIAEEAKVNRATTYVILDSLSLTGLVGKYDEGKKTFFTAGSPETLQSIFEVQKKQIEERRRIFEGILPQLHLIDNKKSGKPVVKFYEGRAGLDASTIELYSSAGQFEKQEPIRMVYPRDMIPKLYRPEEIQRLRQMRVARNIKTKTICTSSTAVESNADSERLQIDGSKHKIGADINVYGDTVRIASFGKKYNSILIKDKEVADTLKSIFDLAWEAAKSDDKNKEKKNK